MNCVQTVLSDSSCWGWLLLRWCIEADSTKTVLNTLLFIQKMYKAFHFDNRYKKLIFSFPLFILILKNITKIVYIMTTKKIESLGEENINFLLTLEDILPLTWFFITSLLCLKNEWFLSILIKKFITFFYFL